MTISQAEDNADEYRPISTFAVLALVAGCSSILALTSQILWVFPILATVLSIAAVRDTAIGKSHKVGRGIALVGLALSVGFGVQSFSVFSVNAWIDHSRARETVLQWHQAIRAGEWDTVHGFCAPGLIPTEEDHDGPDHKGHHHDSEEGRKLSEIKSLKNFPAVRSLAACSKITITEIVRGDQQYQGALHLTVGVNGCEPQHSGDELPLVVDLWLTHKNQEEPEVGKDASGFQNVEIWQIIRVDPSE